MFSQTSTAFEFSKSNGPLPRDFTEFYLTDQEYNVSHEIESPFVEQNIISFSNILSSGKIYYNNIFTSYTYSVLQKLYEDKPALTSKIRIYLIKSSSVNAYTTNDGKIYITIGLLSRLENEAQLAFILAHESIHYIKGHAYEYYKYNKMLKKKSYSYEVDDLLKNRYRYSKSNEYEADREGALAYFKTNYCDTIMYSVFNLLHFSDYPEINQPVDKTFFESTYYKLRDEVWLSSDSIKPINADEDYNDIKITHPNTKSRKDEIIRLSKENNKNGKGELFLISQTEFSKIKMLATIELCETLYREKNYEECIYNCYHLLKNYGSNYIIEKIAAKCYYSLSFLNINEVNFSKYKKSGYLAQVAHVVKYIDKGELIALALNSCWNLYLKNNDDNEIKYMLNALFERTENREKNFYLSPSVANQILNFYHYKNDMILDSAYKPEISKLDLIRKSFHTEFITSTEFCDHLTGINKFNFPVVDNDKKTLVIPQLYFLSHDNNTEKTFTGNYLKKLKNDFLDNDLNNKNQLLSIYTLDNASDLEMNIYNKVAIWLDNISLPSVEQITPNSNVTLPENSYIKYIADDFLLDIQKKYRAKYICFALIYSKKRGIKHKQEYVNIIIDIASASITKIDKNYSSSYFKKNISSTKIINSINKINTK